MKYVVREIAANFQSTSTFVFYRNEFQEDFIADLKKKNTIFNTKNVNMKKRMWL